MLAIAGTVPQGFIGEALMPTASAGGESVARAASRPAGHHAGTALAAQLVCAIGLPRKQQARLEATER